MEAGIRVIATQWRINGLANLSKLSDDVIDFCRGMRIYKVQEYSKDTAKVIKSKRIIHVQLLFNIESCINFYLYRSAWVCSNWLLLYS